MKEQGNKKLGRGLFELLGDKEVPKNSEFNQDLIKEIALNKIVTGVYQPRSIFKDHDLEELSRSIRENGLIQPIIVRKIADEEKYEIIAGERRFRGTKMAGLSKIPVIVKDITNVEALEFAIVENVQRSDLLPIEEAKGYKRLISEFSYTQEQLSNRIGKSRSHIANILRLLSLPKEIQEMLNSAKISMGHARAIVGHNDAVAIAHKIVKDSLSVRDVEDLVATRNQKDHIQSNKKINSEYNLKNRQVKSQYLKKVENDLLKLLKMKAKATYDPKKKKGRLVLFYGDLAELEKLINKLNKL